MGKKIACLFLLMLLPMSAFAQESHKIKWLQKRDCSSESGWWKDTCIEAEKMSDKLRIEVTPKKKAYEQGER